MKTNQTAKIYAFTLLREIKNKGYIIITAMVALLALVLIPLIMVLVSDGITEDPVPVLPAGIVVVDTDETLWQSVGAMLPDMTVTFAPDADTANDTAGEDRLIVATCTVDGVKHYTTLLPEDSALDKSSAEYVSGLLSVMVPAAGAEDPAAAIAAMTQQVSADYDLPDEGEDGDDSMQKILGGAVSYFIVIVLYFVCLLFGQTTANSLVIEKSSKLMDFFLATARPISLVMGKVLAIVTSAVLQLLIWTAAIVGGFAIGIAETGDSGTLKQFIDLICALFTPGAVAVALLIAIAGVVMYCAMSAFGGSLASKTEDLNSSNSIFSLILAGSYALCIFTGTFISKGSTPAWAYYVPFTAVMATPGAVLCGTVTLTRGLISLAIVAVFALLMMFLSAKVYVMMSFYRGKVPSVVKVLKMLFSKR